MLKNLSCSRYKLTEQRYICKPWLIMLSWFLLTSLLTFDWQPCKWFFPEDFTGGRSFFFFFKGALSRGSAGYEAVEKFTHCRPSSPWITAILGHPTLKPTRMLSFLPGHHRYVFFNFFFIFEKMSWIGVVPTSCACPQSTVFAEAVDFGSSWSTSSG